MNYYIVILLSVLSASIFYNFNLFGKLLTIKTKFSEIYLSNQILSEKLKQELEAKQDKQIEQTEGFIKFISDSRDWAFEYIENTQETIKQIIDKTEHTIDYHKNFGSMAIEPYSSQITTLVDALEELKTLLPEEVKE
jgi:hypothetical protein